MPLRHLFSKVRYPSRPAELRNSTLYTTWWYYSVELLPGVITSGQYPDTFPMLPRMLLNHCELSGRTCWDIGTMEGLIPTLMCRRGAGSVLASDATAHCVEKLRAVQHYYGVSFPFFATGLMYDIYDMLTRTGRTSFDLINLSGLLYHVFSPLLVLCEIRPFLKRNGLIIVSTNVIAQEGFFMEFNNAGRLQTEANTFWYPSIPLLDYLLRYLKLAPIDLLYLPHTQIQSQVRYVFDKPSGYISVICRAVEDILPTADDQWMPTSAQHSWEHQQLPHWQFSQKQPTSDIAYLGGSLSQMYRKDTRTIDLWKAVSSGKYVASTERQVDSHTLRLSDTL